MRWSLFALLGCAPHLPPPPPDLLQAVPLPDRAGLPDVRLRSHVVATTRMSEHLAVAGGEKDARRAPVTAFVLEHPEHGIVLVDTGFPRRAVTDPDEMPGRLTARLLGLEMGTPLADVLPEIGVDPGEVKHVVLTHVHHDHAAGVEDFPNALIHVDRRDWLWGQHDRTRGVIAGGFAGRSTRHPTWVHGPWGPFDAHTDLFGDGTVLVFPAPGHTPGSMLVLVNTRDHSWLFAGDSAWVDAGWQEPRPKGWPVRSVLEVDWRENMASLYRLQALAAHPDITVISGHEPADLERFPTWPAVWTAAEGSR